MVQVTLYMKKECALCDEILDLLKILEADYPIEIEEIDIYQDDALLEKYHIDIPVVKIKDEEITARYISFEKLETTIKNNL